MSCPEGMTDNQKRTLKLQDIKYVIIQNELWWRNIDGVLLKCINEEQALEILTEMHSGAFGGHYMAETTTHKVLRAGFWWPTLFKDAHRLVKTCDACQRFLGKMKFLGNLPRRLVIVKAPF